MNQIVIPIESLRRIDSWLPKAIGFTADMFMEDIEEILYRYEDKLNFPKDYSLYIVKDKSIYKKECPSDNDFDTRYKFALEVGNNLIIKLPYKRKDKKGKWEDAITQSEEEIYDIWNNHIKSPTEKDEDIYNALLILTAIYYKHINTTGFFEFEFSAANEIPSSLKKRREMLELYLYFFDKKQSEENIKILHGNKKGLELDNEEGWFTDMMNLYFSKYLHVNGVDDVKKELANYPINYSTSRGPKTDITSNNIIMGAYRLIKNTSLASKKDLSNEEAEFILDYIEYLNVNKRLGIEDLRALITTLKPNTYTIQWYNPAL